VKFQKLHWFTVLLYAVCGPAVVGGAMEIGGKEQLLGWAWTVAMPGWIPGPSNARQAMRSPQAARPIRLSAIGDGERKRSSFMTQYIVSDTGHSTEIVRPHRGHT
jgi:hypothetical protein